MKGYKLDSKSGTKMCYYSRRKIQLQGNYKDVIRLRLCCLNCGYLLFVYLSVTCKDLKC